MTLATVFVYILLMCLTWLVRGWLLELKNRFVKVELECQKLDKNQNEVRTTLAVFDDRLTRVETRLTRVEDKLYHVIIVLSGIKKIESSKFDSAKKPENFDDASV